jgi:hypothetical protein
MDEPETPIEWCGALATPKPGLQNENEAFIDRLGW